MKDNSQISITGNEIEGYEIYVDGKRLPKVNAFMHIPAAIGQYLVSREAAVQQEKGRRTFILPQYGIFSRGTKVEAGDAWEAHESKNEGEPFGKWTFVRSYMLGLGNLKAVELTPELEDAIKLGKVFHDGKEWKTVQQ